MQVENQHSIEALLSNVCQELEISVKLRDFQHQFFEQALNEINGFLRVVYR